MLPSCFFGAKALITFFTDKLSGTLEFFNVCGQGTLHNLVALVTSVLWLSSPLTSHLMMLKFV